MMLFLAEFAACDDGRAHVIAQSSAAPKEASHTTDSAPRMRQPPGKSSNVYCDDFGFVGSSVGGADAEAFFRARFRENGAGAAGHDGMRISTVFRALTLDDLQSVWWSSPARLTSAGEQSSYDRGLAAAALAYGIPIRVDQQLPGDVLASTLYGARTAARCTADANPRGWFEGCGIANWPRTHCCTARWGCAHGRRAVDVIQPVRPALARRHDLPAKRALRPRDRRTLNRPRRIWRSDQ